MGVTVFGPGETSPDWRNEPRLAKRAQTGKASPAGSTDESTRGRIRTCDLSFRKAPLYPLSYAGGGGKCSVLAVTGEAKDTRSGRAASTASPRGRGPLALSLTSWPDLPDPRRRRSVSKPDDPLFRLLDASANRAAEGLRTMEEFARMIANDRERTEALKSLRHELTAAMDRIPRGRLLRSRNTPGDVGTSVEQASEYRRREIHEVIAAAAARTQQSLRCLEEYGKLVTAAFPRRIEQLRYRCYAVASELEAIAREHWRRDRLRRSRLYLLIDSGASETDFVRSLAALATAGVDIFQLRDRACDDRTLYERARVGTRVAHDHDALFIVNDRADIAAASGADGVHVGQDELPAEAARRVLGGEPLVGVSTHDLGQARQAVRDGADYIGCGPVYPSPTKRFDSFAGPDWLRDVAREIDIPAFAIGGISRDNLGPVLEAGVGRVAVTAAVRSAVDPVAAAEELAEALRSPP